MGGLWPCTAIIIIQESMLGIVSIKNRRSIQKTTVQGKRLKRLNSTTLTLFNSDSEILVEISKHKFKNTIQNKNV